METYNKGTMIQKIIFNNNEILRRTNNEKKCSIDTPNTMYETVYKEILPGLVIVAQNGLISLNSERDLSDHIVSYALSRLNLVMTSKEELNCGDIVNTLLTLGLKQYNYEELGVLVTFRNYSSIVGYKLNTSIYNNKTYGPKMLTKSGISIIISDTDSNLDFEEVN